MQLKERTHFKFIRICPSFLVLVRLLSSYRCVYTIRMSDPPPPSLRSSYQEIERGCHPVWMETRVEIEDLLTRAQQILWRRGLKGTRTLRISCSSGTCRLESVPRRSRDLHKRYPSVSFCFCLEKRMRSSCFISRLSLTGGPPVVCAALSKTMIRLINIDFCCVTS